MRTGSSSCALDFTMTNTADEFVGSTWAACIRASSSTAQGMGIMAATNSSNTLFMCLQLDVADKLQFYDTAVANPTAASVGVWANEWSIAVGQLVAFGTPPRFHTFRWSTGAWVHENGGSNLTLPGSVGANGKFRLGPGEMANWNGQYAAAAYWPRLLGDSEIERLSRGRWQMLDPWFHWSERYSTTPQLTGARDLGRERCKYLATAGNTSYAGTGPPGFRFPAEELRR